MLKQKKIARLLRFSERVFFLLFLLAFGWCTYVLIESSAFQAYQKARLESALEEKSLRQSNSSYGSSLGNPNVNGERSSLETQPRIPIRKEAIEYNHAPSKLMGSPIQDPDLIGRLDIPRLGLSAIVSEGVDNRTLRRALGHIPGTALPGQGGNMGIAGHRDTFFRKLEHVRPNDTVTLTTVYGTYRYVVQSLEVVGPDDTEVLRNSAQPTLTLVTCYPFDFVGPAPRRFVVIARAAEG